MGPLKQQIRFCTGHDGVRVAYATSGDGPPLVKVANWISHLEFDAGSPVWSHLIAALSSDHTLLRYDQRGTGLSDWDVPNLTFEDWVRDLETLVDALGLERFPLLGISQGGPVAVAYAVRHPERVSHLILHGAYARGRLKRKPTPQQREEAEMMIKLAELGWGQQNPAFRQFFTSQFIPGGTREQHEWFNELERTSTSPANAARMMRVFDEIDVVDLLPRVSCPTLVLHTTGDARVPFDEGRLFATHIANARFIPLDSNNHLILESEPAWARCLQEVDGFLRSAPEPGLEEVASAVARASDLRRVLLTLLFTDIVDSTQHAERLGDKRWRQLLDWHHEVVRRQVVRFGGRVVDTAGDGFFATFDRPARAVRCSVAIRDGIRALGVEIRGGVHTGECELAASQVRGVAVHIAARVMAAAEPGQILVSSTVRDLVVGSDLRFSDRGARVLKGLQGEWHLHAVQVHADVSASEAAIA
jgi:class 3 adenylate cyclase/pimeloyl-ACP methyl ester carboxylesterase